MKLQVFCKISLLSLLNATIALNLTPRDLAKYDEKLTLYQNMTGINERTFNEIWEMGISNRKFLRFYTRPLIFSLVQYYVPYENSNRFSRQEYTEPTMARYGLTTEETAPTSPVIFDHEFFNHQMRYNNGIFIIDNPGYYRIDMKSYHNSGGSLSNSYLCLHLMINSISELHQ